jgi:hypothetical protein
VPIPGKQPGCSLFPGKPAEENPFLNARGFPAKPKSINGNIALSLFHSRVRLL